MSSWFSSVQTNRLNLDVGILRAYVEDATNLNQAVIDALKAETVMPQQDLFYYSKMKELKAKLIADKKSGPICMEQAAGNPPQFQAAGDPPQFVDVLRAHYWHHCAEGVVQVNPPQNDALPNVVFDAQPSLRKHKDNIAENRQAIAALMAAIKNPAANANRPSPVASYNLLAAAKANIVYSLDQLHEAGKKKLIEVLSAKMQAKNPPAPSQQAVDVLVKQLDEFHQARKKAIEDALNEDIIRIQKLHASNLANVVLMSRLNKKTMDKLNDFARAQQPEQLTFDASSGTSITLSGEQGKNALSFSYGQFRKALTTDTRYWKRVESDVLDAALFIKSKGHEKIELSIDCPQKEEAETVRRTYAKLLEAGFDPHQIQIVINQKSYVGGPAAGKEIKGDTIESVFFKDYAGELAQAKQVQTESKNTLASEDMENEFVKANELAQGGLAEQIQVFRNKLNALKTEDAAQAAPNDEPAAVPRV